MATVSLARSLRSSGLAPQAAEGGEHSVDILGGPAAPTAKPLTALRDDVVRGEADNNRSGTSRHVQEVHAARRIQALARTFLCRRRYRRYCYFVRLDQEMLRERRRRIAVVLMQRIVRGFCARRRFFKRRFVEEERRREEGSKGKGKKGGGGKKAAAAAAPPPPLDLSTVPLPTPETIQLCREAALLRNQLFVSAVRQLIEDKFDESMATIEAILKAVGNGTVDPMVTKLQAAVQRKKNVSMGLAPNAVPPPPAGGGGAKKKK